MVSVFWSYLMRERDRDQTRPRPRTLVRKIWGGGEGRRKKEEGRRKKEEGRKRQNQKKTRWINADRRPDGQKTSIGSGKGRVPKIMQSIDLWKAVY